MLSSLFKKNPLLNIILIAGIVQAVFEQPSMNNNTNDQIIPTDNTNDSLSKTISRVILPAVLGFIGLGILIVIKCGQTFKPRRPQAAQIAPLPRAIPMNDPILPLEPSSAFTIIEAITPSHSPITSEPIDTVTEMNLSRISPLILSGAQNLPTITARNMSSLSDHENFQLPGMSGLFNRS